MLWIGKYEVVFNMINDYITFFPKYCIYFEIFLSLISPKPKKTETIVQAILSDIISDRMLEITSQ